MATPLISTAFVSGEISPAVYGRVDVERERVAATTMRNGFVDYRGGYKSRAGTAFVGFSKQTGRSFPPRMIPFQFSINQGLALEFGHEYMRVISDGGFVTNLPVAIGGATNANPCVLTFGTEGASAATPINTGVTGSYAPGDLISLAGGTELAEAVLSVTTSQLVSILVASPGSGYTVSDTVTLAGGTSSVSAVATVASVVAVAASGFITFAVNPSDGDTITLNSITWTFKTTPTGSNQTRIQPTLAGTLAQLATDVSASSSGSLTVASYSSTATTFNILYDTTGTGGNSYTLAASVATPSAGTLTGGTTTGLGTVNVTTPGVFSVLPTGGNMTQSGSSGGGTGASFQTAIFGPHAVTVSSPGAYTAVPANPVSQDTSTGAGLGATFNVTWVAVPAFSNGDWIAVAGVVGMTELNGNTYVVTGATTTTVELTDVYGNPVDSTLFGAYVSGGTASKIFTLATIYSEQDLPYLKFTQSADVMSICCVNQATGTEYPPQDLSRTSDTSWAFSQVVAVPTVSPPRTVSCVASGVGSEFYHYSVTAVSPIDGSESAAHSAGCIGVDISSTKGQIDIQWRRPLSSGNIRQYNIYKAQPNSGVPVPPGSLHGYIASAYGLEFIDTNFIPDFAQVPPLHLNPFARGQIIDCEPTAGGSGYTSGPTVTITTSTGSGASIAAIVQGGVVVGFIIIDNGQNYAPTDTATLTGGGGSGAKAQLTIGAESGTYPSACGYFQERRVYANTLNQTDTYFMSQPGAFLNFDARIPPIDTDAITGSPWSLQVNGIQWLVQTAGGLLVMTGSSAWLLVGAGSFATNVQPISPSSQDDVPQAFSGVSSIVPPVKINYDVLYVNSKNSYYYALPYQLYVLSEPIDITELSVQLFLGFTIRENAWCEQPNKIMWAIRDDGVMLSLTYYKSQQVAGWARHDTNGFFVSCCSITEPPVDALYIATERFPGTHTAYMIERMDNRIWSTVEDCWCVDAALNLTQPTPNASLTASSQTGLGACSGVTGLVGGAGYSPSTTATVIDSGAKFPGTGAVVALTIDPVTGAITAAVFSSEGSGYSNPVLVFYDPANTGSGASATVTLDTSAAFTASSAVFSLGDVGSVIRMGGGIATITAYTDTTHVTAMINVPITALVPNEGEPATAAPGQWTKTAPVSRVTGLEHLVGATVTGLADGSVITPRVVDANGGINLDVPASAVTVGLGFQCQLQGVYFDAGAPSVQGQRKKIAAGNILVEASRGLSIGGAQVDGSTLSPPMIDVEWPNMTAVPDKVPAPYNWTAAPLYTGYNRIPVGSGFNLTGQVAVQQENPLPMNINSIVSEVVEGDTPDQTASKGPERRGGQSVQGAGPTASARPSGPIVPPAAIIAGGGR